VDPSVFVLKLFLKAQYVDPVKGKMHEIFLNEF
jgi:hypothetical protein